MSEWQATTIGEIATVVGGGTPSTKVPSYWGDDVLWLTPGELSKREGQVITSTERRISSAGLANSSAKMLPMNTVLLTSRATVGVVGLAGQPMATNQGFQSLVCGEQVLPGFMMRWVQANKEEFTSRASGSTFPEISGKRIKTIPILLPSLTEQRRIVDVMTGVDALVDSLAEEIIRANETYTNTSSLLWLDDAGVEFTARALGDVMKLDVERVWLDPDRTYAMAGVLGSGQGMIDKGTFLGRETEYQAMNLLREEQVVMRKLTAWEGPITVVPKSFEGYVASNEFPTFTLCDDIDPAWMRHVCRTSRLWAEMKNRVTGSVQRRKRLNPDQLLAVSLPIPPREVQERVSAGLDALDGQLADLSHELAALRSFRACLLTALLHQEVEIPESYDSLLETAS